MRHIRLLTLCGLVALAGAAPLHAQEVPARNLTQLAHWDEYQEPGLTVSYSSCWAYVHPDGREYAVIGTHGGTAIYNVTNPAASYRVGFVPGPPCLWREMKSYRTWIYTVSECLGTNQGLQIISMADPESPVLAGTYQTNFNRSHTVSVDTTRARLLCNGTRNAANQASGLRILSLANPVAPVEVGRWPAQAPPVPSTLYAHDSVPIGDRLFVSSIHSGFLRILDFADPDTPVEVHSFTYDGAFTHNAWPDASGNYLYATDEVKGEPLKVFDISNPLAPQLVDTFTPNPAAIVHNAHVLGDELYLANYTEGVRVLDLSDPAHPAEFAWADTYPGPSGGFFGVWEFCPYFPSGTVIASDMQSGLYVFRVERDYGLVTVRVVDGPGGPPMENVEVRLVEQGDLRLTAPDGVVRFGPSPGSHTVRVESFYYEPFEAVVAVADGSDDTVQVALIAKPLVDFSGTVRDHATGIPLEDARLTLEVSPLNSQTDADGSFFMPTVPAGEYEVRVRRPGYAPLLGQMRQVAPPVATQDYRLHPANLWDALEAASGWTVGAPGDAATTGIWTRVEPLGTGKPGPGLDPLASGRSAGALRPAHEGHETDGAPPGSAQPEFDNTPAPGMLCFVTGQGTDPANIGEEDVDGGRTTLVSPAYDVTGFADPVFSYWRWFYSSGLLDDYLIVEISSDGGASWAPVDTTHGLHTHWEEEQVRVSDFVPISNAVRLRFRAADDAPGSIVEAAIDDLSLYEGTLLPVSVAARGAVRLALRLEGPQPAASARLHLAGPAGAAARVRVLDAAGRQVRDLFRGELPPDGVALLWDGRDDAGRATGSGLYFLQARVGIERATLRFVRLD